MRRKDSRELIRTRVIGENNQYDVQDARAKAREIIVNEALTCEDEEHRYSRPLCRTRVGER